MLATKLIAELQRLVAENGDLPVGRDDCSYGCEVVEYAALATAYRTGEGGHMDDAADLGPVFIKLG